MSAAQAAAETPSRRPRRATITPQVSLSEVPENRVLALLAVILFYVLSRMLDQDNTPQQFIEWREKAISTLLKVPAGKTLSEAELGAEIDVLMPMAQEEGWIRMDWFLNVLPPSADEVEHANSASGPPSMSVSGSRSLREGGSSYIGLGTMMQDATDYLGERQREDYKRWKAEIMARVEAIEAS